MSSKILKNLLFLSFTLTLCGCIDEEPERKKGFNDRANYFLKKIMEENPAASYEVVLDKHYGKEDGIYKYASGYSLKLLVGSMVVLSNNIDSLREQGIYYESTSSHTEMELKLLGITVQSDNLDTVQIVTDSVIMLPSLELGLCNLSQIPAEIGQLRVQRLDLRSNPHLTTLPIEISNMLEPPKYYPYTEIWFDFPLDSLPTDLKTWYLDVYRYQNFPEYE